MEKNTKVILFVLGIILLLVYFGGDLFSNFDLSEENSTNIQQTNSNSVFKKPNSFEGYQYCSFVFVDEDYLDKSGYLFKPLCNISEYPIIKDFLYDYYSINLVKSEGINFAAYYTGKGNIEISEHFKVAKNLDLYLAHEIAHSSTETLNLPTWLNEGIAEYSAYRYFKTDYKLENLQHKDILHWIPSNSPSEIGNNIRGYAHSAYIVKKFVVTYGDDKLRELILALDGRINQEDTIDVKNSKVLEVIREVTNNPHLSFEDII